MDSYNLSRPQYYEENMHGYPSQVGRHFITHVKKDLADTLIVDIGVGTWNDAKHFLTQGAQVIWIDGNEIAKDYLYKNIPTELLEKFTWQTQDLEALDLPQNTVTFSSKTLSFVHPDKLDEMMIKIRESINPRGYFVGNFFGPETNADISIVKMNLDQIQNIFPGFEIIYTKERKWDFYSKQRDKTEFRQIFDIIAQKK